MPLTKIPKDEQLAPGDRVELHFKSSGMAWIKATQIVLLEQKFKGRTDWEIIGWETPVEQPTLLIMRAEIKKFVMEDNPELQQAGVGAVVTCAAIAGVIITAGIVYRLTLQETFLISVRRFY